MKKFKLAGIVFILVVSGGCATVRQMTPIMVREVETIRKIDIAAPAKTLRVGEKLTYMFKMWGLEVGECSLEVKELMPLNGGQAYHLVCTARTTPFFSLFYKINDTVHTYVDKETFYPVKSKIMVQQTTITSDQDVTFDKENHRIKSVGVGRKNRKINIDRAIPEAAYDALSALYRFRTMEIDLDQPIKLDISTPKKDWTVLIKIYKTGQVVIPSGCYDSFLFEPLAKLRDNGKMFEKGRAWIWMSADQNRIPVLIKSRTIFGNPIAYLKDIK